MRKEADFNVIDRISIYYEGSDSLQKAMASQEQYIKNETLANNLIHGIESNHFQKEWTINGEEVVVGILKN